MTQPNHPFFSFIHVFPEWSILSDEEDNLDDPFRPPNQLFLRHLSICALAEGTKWSVATSC